MDRIQTITIAGQAYPLNFSVKAARAIDEKYGSIDKISGIFGASADFSSNLYNIHWVLALLMEQGAAYLRLVEGREIQPPTAEELEVYIGIHNLIEVQQRILEAIGFGMAETVEIEADQKNEETTQSD